MTVIVDASIYQPPYVLMNVDLREEYSTSVKDFYVHMWVTQGVLVCRYVCVMLKESCQVTQCTQMAAEKNVGSSSTVVME